MYVFSTPVFSRNLAAIIETYNPVDISEVDKEKTSAIVVLGCNRHSNAPEFSGNDTVSACTLVRIRYAAFLQKATGFPIIVSGGSVYQESVSEAELMREVLMRELNTEVFLMERNSRNTIENAKEVAKLIVKNKIEQVLLVTHASHMLRAEYSFNHSGINIIPAPTHFYSVNDSKPFYFKLLPNIQAFYISNVSLYEMLGYIWIKI